MPQSTEARFYAAALDNLRSQPAPYTILLALLVLCASGLAILPSEHRVYALITTVLAVVTVLVFLFRREREPECRLPTTHIFSAPTTGKYNEEFYQFFRKCIRNAKEDIYITGDGFGCGDRKGTELARSFVNEFRVALQMGISVVRIQTTDRSSTTWAQMLGDLVKEFPDRFTLYVLPQREVFQLSSVCVIDPDDVDCNVVEIMLSTERLFGDRPADLAGTALFISRNQRFALELRDRILALGPASRRIPSDSRAAVDALAGTRAYFAYGSNMSEEQMRRRCPSATKVGVGIARDYKLVFNRRGSYRAGGVASIAEQQGARTYGVVWRISATNFEVLDRHEDPSAYVRKEIVVNLLDGSEEQCQVYIGIPQGEYQPDEGYLDILLKAAVDAKLPSEYLEELREPRV